MTKLLFIWLIVFIPLSFFGMEIPNHTGQYVSDYAGVLSAQTENDINLALTEFETKTKNQIVVLTVPSLDGESLELFANEVFNKWQIGQKNNNNGVLLLLSLEDKQIRIEVGYGLEGDLPDGVCGSIIRNEIVPYFKAGDFEGGVKSGVSSIINYTGDYQATETGNGSANYSVFYLLFGGAGGLMGLNVFLAKRRRYKKRRSKKTGEKMFRLKETEEDTFLNEGQQLEEKLGSVDYDVWVTADRGDYEILAYQSKFSSYQECPKCNFQTLASVSYEIISHPDFYSNGKAIKKLACKYCQHEEQEVSVLPKKQRATYGGGVYMGGGGFGGGGSFGGGGFGGGGSSGGGGASGGW
jgi:uncharacterized protein